LFTNSQAALLFEDNADYFIESVNFIHSLPFLPGIELSIIALPAIVHAWWGIERLWTSKPDSMVSDGSTPSLGYPKNRAYTWQRITAVVLIFAILFHVVTMRYTRAPTEHQDTFTVRLTDDPLLEPLAAHLQVTIEKQPNGEVVATSDTIGTAILMMVRDTFKGLGYCVGYTIFVLLAAFHSCNGLWTASITWGVTCTKSGRNGMRLFCILLMAALSIFGLACIWGLYYGS
ncbi:MAG: hypothetical protein JSR46_02330, partial [Verrucomicrobia bacterium]|nr:hypothetical protein [Verrucomicrobiota bacterium]